MAMYKKLPVKVEAVKFEGWNNKQQVEFSERPEWLNRDMGNNISLFGDPKTLTIKTKEGNMKAKVGDYIIRGIKGELYPCDPEIFEKTYIQVDENEQEVPLATFTREQEKAFKTLTKSGKYKALQTIFVGVGHGEWANTFKSLNEIPLVELVTAVCTNVYLVRPTFLETIEQFENEAKKLKNNAETDSQFAYYEGQEKAYEKLKAIYNNTKGGN